MEVFRGWGERKTENMRKSAQQEALMEIDGQKFVGEIERNELIELVNQ